MILNDGRVWRDCYRLLPRPSSREFSDSRGVSSLGPKVLGVLAVWTFAASSIRRSGHELFSFHHFIIVHSSFILFGA